VHVELADETRSAGHPRANDQVIGPVVEALHDPLVRSDRATSVDARRRVDVGNEAITCLVFRTAGVLGVSARTTEASADGKVVGSHFTVAVCSLAPLSPDQVVVYGASVTRCESPNAIWSRTDWVISRVPTPASRISDLPTPSAWMSTDLIVWSLMSAT
jgi:hypothetical protein